MVPTWRDRLKMWVCKHFRHKEVVEKYSVSCGRCGVLLKGPLQMQGGSD